MNARRHSLLGFLVWRSGRWYLRRVYLRRLPPRRRAVVAGGGALALSGALAALAARARG